MNGRGLRHCLCLFVLVFTAILDLSLISVLSTSQNTVSSPSTSSTSSTFPLLAVAYGAYGGDAALPCILHFGMFNFYCVNGTIYRPRITNTAAGFSSFVCLRLSLLHEWFKAFSSGVYVVVFLMFLVESLGFVRSLEK